MRKVNKYDKEKYGLCPSCRKCRPLPKEKIEQCREYEEKKR